jgi:hypothetical protein
LALRENDAEWRKWEKILEKIWGGGPKLVDRGLRWPVWRVSRLAQMPIVWAKSSILKRR